MNTTMIPATLFPRRAAVWRAFLLCLGLAFTAPAWALLPIQHWTTAAGTRVYFVASPAIPMLDVQIQLDAGERRDPAGKAGLAAMTAGLLTSGTQSGAAGPALDEAAISDGLADLGAQLGANAGADSSVIALRTLTTARELDGAVDILGRILAAPSYPSDILAREKARSISELKEGLKKPEVLAARDFAAALYPDHPYGIKVTEDSLSALSASDLHAFYQANYRASTAVITMVGAIDRARAEAIAERLSAALPQPQADAQALPPLPPVMPLAAAREIRHPFDSAQSHIIIGQPAVARKDPDYLALVVGNYVLGGGGFVSRLMQEVREKRGLSYGVGSYFDARLQTGPFQLGLQTRKDQTEQSLAVVRETLARFVAEGPTDAELAAAKSNLINGFPLSLDSNRKLLGVVGRIGWYQLPLDELDTWTARVKAMTREQVKAAFARHLDPAKMVTVVVGPAAP